MTGTLIFKKHITKTDIRATFPTHLYLFGDNMWRRGYGGQAQEMRGHTNSIGVPTKWSPQNVDKAYFKDDDFAHIKPEIDFAFDLARGWLSVGNTVVIPADGLGTGLADLPNRAPIIHYYIKKKIAELNSTASTFMNED